MADCQWLWYHLVLVSLVQGALAALNITLDDTDKSIQYSGNWRTACPFPDKYQYQCPNLDETNDGTLHWTWSAVTGDSPGHITISFTGTAVYVYNVLASFAGLSEDLATNITFTLDGGPVGSYEQQLEAYSERGYKYGQLVYANASLSHGNHVLAIIAGNSPVFFDYIQYTPDSSKVSPPAMSPNPSLRPPLTSSIMATSTTMSPQYTIVPVPSMWPGPVSEPYSPVATDAPTSSTTSLLTSITMGSITYTATDTTTTTETASSQAGSNLSARAIAGGIVGSVLALLLLGVITLHARRRLSTRRVGKGMGRLLDEAHPPLMHNAYHFASNRRQFLHPMNPALRPSPNLPRSPPGYVHTISSMPTRPEPPSRTYMSDGTVTRILETADRARTEWPSSTGTRAFPAASRMMSLTPDYSE